MTRKPPPIAPCPKGHKTVRVITNATGRMKRVDCCSCGWAGPLLDTERLAILAWNRRSSDAEAERRGAMKIRFALRDLLLAMSGQADGVRSAGFSPAVNKARAMAYRAIGEAIASGEVMPAAKPEPWVVSRRGVMGGKPCVRGTRITVETIQRVAHEWSSLKILEEYPSLTAEGLAAALVYRLPAKKGAKRT